MTVADTHAHLHDPAFEEDRDEVIPRALAQGVGAIITAGTDMESSRVALGLAESYPWVHAAVGFHPHEASRLTQAALRELRSLAARPGVVAIGEIGLDFYRDLSPREVQERALESQLDLASALGLPVIVHCREAHDQTMAILRRWAAGYRRADGRPMGVMHCFSGNEQEGLELVGMGFLLSFAGPITFPRSQRARRVARALPMDSLLVETDCPYLTPSAHYGRRNEPAFVWAVAQGLAEARGIGVGEVASATSANAQRLFGISLTRKEDIGDPFPIPVNSGRST